MSEIRHIGVPDNLTVCRLLPVEGFLLWAFRAWCAGDSQAEARALRWELHGAFQRFGVATEFAAFDLGMCRLACAPPAGTPDFHSTDCLCVGDSERRWLNALGALQRGSRDDAAESLSKVIRRETVLPVLDAFEPLAHALAKIGWAMPPWRETSARADDEPRRAPRAHTPSLRLVVSQPSSD